MFKKTLLFVGISSVLVSGAASASGLTLVSKNVTSPIAVYCNKIKGLYDIKPNGQLGPLPWVIISAMFHSNKLQCSFKLDNGSNKVIGTANMLLSLTTGTIKNVQIKDPAHYTATSNESWGIANKNMTVTLTKIK